MDSSHLLAFKGEEELRANQLQLNVNKLGAEVLEKIGLMPEVIHRNYIELLEKFMINMDCL